MSLVSLLYCVKFLGCDILELFVQQCGEPRLHFNVAGSCKMEKRGDT